MSPTDPLTDDTHPVLRAGLRILATTDTHGHLRAHDYIKDRPTQGTGLAGLAPVIRTARGEAAAQKRASLLVDNGDTFQGTPLARHLARRPVTAEHGIVAALNALEYDVVGLGNHDLDFGLSYLRKVAGALNMPMVCSNLAGPGLAPLVPHTLIDTPLPGTSGCTLRVGVLALLPGQTAQWHAHVLGSRRMVESKADQVRGMAATLRAAGADLILLLAHMGVGPGDHTDRQESGALALARQGIADALVLGHVHNRLPSQTYCSHPEIDGARGLIAGVPAVMPGHAGSDLGVIDLDLVRDSTGRWRIEGHSCALHPHPPAPSDAAAIGADTNPAHQRLRRYLRTEVARTETPLHSFFTHAAPARTQALVARAKRRLLQKHIDATAHAHLPVLTAVAAHASGGRDGPANFLNIPAGPVLRRHVMGLDPFANQTGAGLITGADLRARLEHAGAIFNTAGQEGAPCPLINAAVPGFQFDAVFGVSCRFDITAPPYSRVRDLTGPGGPIQDSDEFVLIASQFRLAGGGGYAPIEAARMLVPPRPGLEQAIVRELREPLPASEVPWSFATGSGVRVVLHTDPDATAHLTEIAHLAPQVHGRNADGFLELSLTL
ncbi:5'-nucleotidase C-terminal domain-containing protein [Sulfitobacter albidus]|uniref:5'-nucleotidase C-terminal domain-containing protein n=1 Tax=Sulfitobacter albidus TaxID=2829501 RepID=A0A975PM38_9RHOB|nr:5'-nucleotidase C-terminal domain-containing protein [Sulfitobacter albidus]QUJ75830.1 5'-nucleotidase C-terminal domain-containing protein [Sulfitobacter albidus]